MKSELIWEKGLEFTAKGESGHRLTMDVAPESGGKDRGARPMELLLHGTAGCSAIDIVLILKKMKVELEDFRMEVEASRAEQYPQRFTKIKLHYFLQGKGLTDKNVKRAIELSLDKYCSAVSSLNAEIEYTYQFSNG